MLYAILNALAVAAVYIVVYTVVLLTIDVIIDYFENWHTENEVDYDDVGFAIKESLESGDVRVVQGVFNKNSGTIKDARRIKAEDIDEDTRIRLGEEKLTIFN